MNKIAIFYHVYQFAEWEKMFFEQIQRLGDCGLIDAADFIHIGVNGDSPLPVKFNMNHNVHFNSPENFDSELETMIDLHKFCVENIDYKILYFHTKGISVSSANSELVDNVTAWRKYLERFNIDNWRKCTELLETYDCVGTEWETDMCLGGKRFISPCYAGTFWWANSSYISKLDPNLLFLNEWGENSRRYQCEFWIGKGNPKYYNFYSSNKNKYYTKLNSEEYEQFL